MCQVRTFSCQDCFYGSQFLRGKWRKPLSGPFCAYAGFINKTPGLLPTSFVQECESKTSSDVLPVLEPLGLFVQSSSLGVHPASFSWSFRFEHHSRFLKWGFLLFAAPVLLFYPFEIEAYLLESACKQCRTIKCETHSPQMKLLLSRHDVIAAGLFPHWALRLFPQIIQ